VQAITTLCGPGTHINIVQVLRHGNFSHSDFYFIDMELCDMNLRDYLHPRSSEPSGSLPQFTRGAGSKTVSQIWDVMQQIAAGLEYIHLQGQVHRDIKPANSTCLLSATNIPSSVLFPRFCMEVSRFWVDHGRNVKNEPPDTIRTRNLGLSSPRTHKKRRQVDVYQSS
jgi:hypothetical protein